MAHWVRFEHGGATKIGTLNGDAIAVHSGAMFDNPKPTGETLKVSDVKLKTPCDPTKIVAMWNNFHALAAKLNVAEPTEPLYLLKSVSSITDPGAVVKRPVGYDGPVVFEGELGIVIGKTATNVSESEAAKHIFGYTCVNDITAAAIIQKDPTFAQWARAKGYDGFGPFGPAIATDVKPETLTIKTILNGQERQNYPISDMIFPAAKLVSLLSSYMTLYPGDLIECGTSVGVGSMKEKVNQVSIIIEGVGQLNNTVEV